MTEQFVAAPLLASRCCMAGCLNGHTFVVVKVRDFDGAGLDTCLAIMRVLHEGLGDSKYRPCPLLVQYVDAGWWGKKVGKGVFEYPG